MALFVLSFELGAIMSQRHIVRLRSVPTPRRGHVKPRAPIIDIRLPGLLCTGEVMAVSGLSHSALYARMQAGLFPRPQKLGGRNAWRTDVVREALGL